MLKSYVYSFSFLFVYSTNTLANTYDVASVDELQTALTYASVQPGTHTINIKPGIYDIALNRGESFFFESEKAGALNLQRSGPIGEVIFKGIANGGILEIISTRADFSVLIDNIRFTDAGRTALDILGVTAVSIHNSEFIGNESSYGPGALRVSEAGANRVVICNSRFLNNASTTNGGAVSFDNTGRAYVIQSQFVENASRLNGGAISVQDKSEAFIALARFDRNRANQGGAIDSSEPITIASSQFTENKAATGSSMNILGTARIYSSRFDNHEGDSVIEVSDAELWHNQFIRSAGHHATGDGSKLINNLFYESDFFVSSNDVLLNNLIVSTRVDSANPLNPIAIVAQSNVASNATVDPRINYSENGINLELKLPAYGADANDFYPIDKSALVDAGSDPKIFLKDEGITDPKYIPPQIGNHRDIGPYEFQGTQDGLLPYVDASVWESTLPCFQTSTK